MLQLWRCRDVGYRQNLVDRILGIAHIEVDRRSDATNAEPRDRRDAGSRQLFEQPARLDRDPAPARRTSTASSAEAASPSRDEIRAGRHGAGSGGRGQPRAALPTPRAVRAHVVLLRMRTTARPRCARARTHRRGASNAAELVVQIADRARCRQPQSASSAQTRSERCWRVDSGHAARRGPSSRSCHRPWRD